MKKFDQYGVTEQLRNDTKKLFNGILADVVKEYDPTIFYWPSSPYGGDPDAKCESGKPNWNPNGDAHYWGVWQGVDSVAHFNKVKARFFSEYGFQSFPEYQSVLKYAPEERDHDIYSDVMMAHQRGGQMPYNMGSLFWQHNDCWPVASWSNRDYYGRWKAQNYFTKKAFRDILVSPIAEDGTLNVWVISDRLKAVKGKLDIRVMDLKGTVLFSKNSNVTLPANTSKIQFSAPVESLLAGKNLNEVVVNARFIENGKESDRSVVGDDLHEPEHHVGEVLQELAHGGVLAAVEVHGKAEEQGEDDQRQHRPPREQSGEIVDGEEVDEQRRKRRGIVHRARCGIGPRRQHRRKDTHDDQHDKGREQPGDNEDAERRAEDTPRPAPRARIGDAARERAEHQRHDEAEHHVDEHGAERLKADSPGPGRADGAAEHDAGKHRGKEAVAPIEGMGHKKPSDLPDFCVYLYP